MESNVLVGFDQEALQLHLDDESDTYEAFLRRGYAVIGRVKLPTAPGHYSKRYPRPAIRVPRTACHCPFHLLLRLVLRSAYEPDGIRASLSFDRTESEVTPRGTATLH